ncbi:MAG: hypothetical protein ACI3Z0_03295, partial [Candidatus Cryptobacteroides sp.]
MMRRVDAIIVISVFVIGMLIGGISTARYDRRNLSSLTDTLYVERWKTRARVTPRAEKALTP